MQNHATFQPRFERDPGCPSIRCTERLALVHPLDSEAKVRDRPSMRQFCRSLSLAWLPYLFDVDYDMFSLALGIHDQAPALHLDRRAVVGIARGRPGAGVTAVIEWRAAAFRPDGRDMDARAGPDRAGSRAAQPDRRRDRAPAQ
mgnify:CR=1 FL=1